MKHFPSWNLMKLQFNVTCMFNSLSMNISREQKDKCGSYLLSRLINPN